MIDRQLDGIHVMLLRLDNDDQYKEALYKEYELYRTSLEALPRDVNIPQILDTSVFSFEQRLKNYIVLGKSNNPLIELAPTISKRITSREDIAEILQIANSNSSYIQNKKSQLEVLKSYLDQINFNGDIDDIFSTIKLVEERYLKLNIYSNEFEQEIAKAKYYYELKLLYDGEISRAKEYAEKFDSDLILFIHSHHKDTVHKLLNDGKSKLADELNSFLTEFPKDREKDIEFWKTLAQIENPEYNPKADIEVNSDNSIIVDEIEEKKEVITTTKKEKFSFIRRILRRDIPIINPNSRFISNANYTIKVNDDSVEINLRLLKEFKIEKVFLEHLVNCLGNLYKKNNEAFSNVKVYVEENKEFRLINSNELDSVGIGRIVRGIIEYAHIQFLHIKCASYSKYYTLNEGEFQGTYFDKIVVQGGTWELKRYCLSRVHFLKEADFSGAYINKIEDYAFSGSDELEKVVLPSIDEYTFGKYIFMDCVKLKDFEWPYNIETIKEGFFKNCRSLQTIGANKLKTIQDRAFEGCEKFGGIVFSSDIECIGHRAFFGCKALNEFNFKSIREIGDYAFSESGLTSVTISLPLHRAGNGIFAKSKIVSARIENTLALTNEIFMDCKELERVRLDDGIAVFGKSCFEGCINLESINIPSILGLVSERCFKNCFKLTKILLPKGCHQIEAESFSGCKSITEFYIPGGTRIENRTFYECTHLEKVSFEKIDEILEIGDKAFCLCERLNDFTMPPNVKLIGESAFAGTDLKEAILPDSVTDLGDGAFNECRRLEKVKMSTYVRSIGNETFKNCYNLKEVDMTDCYISSIGKQAFYKCESLETLILPNGLRKVSKTAFDKAYSIKYLFIPYSILNAKKDDDNFRTILVEFKYTIGLDDFDLLNVLTEDDKYVQLELKNDYYNKKVVAV